MAIPKYFEMYRPFLEVMKDGGLYSLKDIKEAVAKAFSLSKEEQVQLLPSGKQAIFDNRIGWTRTYLKKSGLIESPARAKFLITDRGISALNSGVAIDDQYLKQYKEFCEFISSESKDDKKNGLQIDDKDLSPEEIFENSFKEIQNTLASDLMEEVMKLPPYDFEKLVVKLLEAMGYGSKLEHPGTVTQATNDGGIDGIIKEDQLGFSSIYIQAKKWALDRTIDKPEVQKFAGALVGLQANKGLFITTAKYTKGARDFAGNLLGSKIVLIDGDDLTKLMIKYNLGVSVERVYEIKRVDTDFFEDGF